MAEPTHWGRSEPPASAVLQRVTLLDYAAVLGIQLRAESCAFARCAGDKRPPATSQFLPHIDLPVHWCTSINLLGVVQKAMFLGVNRIGMEPTRPQIVPGHFPAT